MNLDACRPLRLKPHAYPGVLITFCGIDGSGKSSLIEKVEELCRATGQRYMTTFTPTPRIRRDPVFRALVNDPCNTACYDASSYHSPKRVNVLGLLLSIMGDLVQHCTDTIIPHLQQGEVVVCDRYVFTSHAEILARSHLSETQPVLATIAERLPKPDLAFGLRVPLETAKERVLAREDDEDRPPPMSFLERQARAYQAVIESNSLVALDTGHCLDDTTATLMGHLRQIPRARLGTCGVPDP